MGQEKVKQEPPDVETYPVPVKLGSGDAYLDRVWAAAAKGLDTDVEEDAA